MTSSSQALREIERSFVYIRSIAAADASWYAYRKRVLPEHAEQNVVALVNQGYEAGYMDAMAAASAALAEVQTEALRGE